MVRWTILLGTFALWITCMSVVYVHCKPVVHKDALPGAQAGLEAMFEDDAEMERAWHVYIDPRDLEHLGKADKGNAPRSGWFGIDETRLTPVGWFKTTYKKRTGDSRLEQLTEAEITVPSQANIPMLQMLGTLTYRNRANISLDMGLENFSAEFNMGLGFKVLSLGVRDNEYLTVTQQIFQNETKLHDQKQKLLLGLKGMPTMELMPFQPNPGVRKGAVWDITVLDTSTFDITEGAPPGLTAVKAICIGQRNITFNKAETKSFEVKTLDGKARAFYSADGVVLKQSFKLADMLEIVLVRVDAKTHSIPGATPAAKAKNKP